MLIQWTWHLWFTLITIAFSNPWTTLRVHGSRQRVRDRIILFIIIFVLLSGILVEVVINQVCVLKVSKTFVLSTLGLQQYYAFCRISSSLPTLAPIGISWDCRKELLSGNRLQVCLVMMIAGIPSSPWHARCLMTPHDEGLVKHLGLRLQRSLLLQISMLIDEHVFWPTRQGLRCFKLRVRQIRVCTAFTKEVSAGRRCGIMWDG